MAVSDSSDRHLLVVDDDDRIRELLKQYLTRHGFRVTAAPGGAQARKLIETIDFDLAVFDVMMPGEDGVALTGSLRETMQTPILLLTARGDADDRIRGLEAGADDYVPKPFKTQELLARVKTRLRRSSRPDEDPSTLRIGDIVIDVDAHTVHRSGEPLSLTPLEFDLLLALARKPRQAFTRELLLQEVWGYRHPGDTRLVNVHVQRLRSKIEADPEHPEIIVTVRGIGYRAGTPTSP